jgi:uncharacterized protein (TIGR02271 family)
MSDAKQEWYPIVDAEGRRGRFASATSSEASLQVLLDSGERLQVPRSSVQADGGGAYRFAHNFASLVGAASDREIVFPVVAEVVEVERRSVPRERVTLRTTVSTHEEVVDVSRTREDLQVERVAIGRVVETASAPRQEGDTLIVPVYEEVIVVEKRLLLREEVHVKRVRSEEHAPQTVSLRKEEVTVERTDLRAPPAST